MDKYISLFSKPTENWLHFSDVFLFITIFSFIQKTFFITLTNKPLPTIVCFCFNSIQLLTFLSLLFANKHFLMFNVCSCVSLGKNLRKTSEITRTIILYARGMSGLVLWIVNGRWFKQTALHMCFNECKYNFYIVVQWQTISSFKQIIFRCWEDLIAI